eukprot:2554474-Rhodomonas_salina.1
MAVPHSVLARRSSCRAALSASCVCSASFDALWRACGFACQACARTAFMLHLSRAGKGGRRPTRT